MTLYELSKIIPIPREFVKQWDCEIKPNDWSVEDGAIILDLRRIKDNGNNLSR